MFETAQQEPSSNAPKVVGVVILVVVVLMVGLYFLFLRQEPAATTGAGKPAATPAGATAGEEQPNVLRDLSILKFNLGRDQTGTMALWDIQLANRSRTFAYKNIQYATNYYNAEGAVLYQNQSTIKEELGPGDQRTISGINDGLYPVGTTRYTIEIKEAEGVRP